MAKGIIELILTIPGSSQEHKIEVNYFTFAGGEVQVTLPDYSYVDAEIITIRANIESSDDVMALIMTKDALDRRVSKYTKVYLIMKYLPYSRQDRVCAPRQAFSLKAFARLIDNLFFERILTWDVHSGVAQEVFKTPLDVIHLPELFNMIGFDIFQYDYLISPDKGAMLKVANLGARFSFETGKVISASKVRDPVTGDITETKTPYVEDAGAYKALVVDDICDGGRTFIELSKSFVKDKVIWGQLDLFVTHGIFSKGLHVLLEHYSNIYSTNSLLKPTDYDNFENFKVFTPQGELYENIVCPSS